MFSDLPKAVGITFLLGSFLPAVILVGGTVLVLSAFTVISGPETLVSTPFHGVLSLFGTWVVAAILVVINFQLTRLLEGYSVWPPIPFRGWHLRRFDKKIKPLLEKAEKIESARLQKKEPPKAEPDFPRKLAKAFLNYPRRREWVLPTRFGNIMRAFETYSFEIYGIDAIPNWPRMMMVVPAEAQKKITEGKALLDFFINLIPASLVVLGVYGWFAWNTWSLPAIWLPVLAAALLLSGWYFMHGAAIRWGENVKSVFDLYRGALASNLGLKIPNTSSEERELWRQINRTMIYGGSAAANIDRFRERPALRSWPQKTNREKNNK